MDWIRTCGLKKLSGEHGLTHFKVKGMTYKCSFPWRWLSLLAAHEPVVAGRASSKEFLLKSHVRGKPLCEYSVRKLFLFRWKKCFSWPFFMWVKQTFEEADKNGDGLLNIEEIHQLMHKLNVNLPRRKVRQMFQVRFHSWVGLYVKYTLEKNNNNTLEVIVVLGGVSKAILFHWKLILPVLYCFVFLWWKEAFCFLKGEKKQFHKLNIYP